MTKDEILSMAREAGFMPAHDNRVQRFAALVAEKATEQANARQNASWARMCEKMVAAEREACADIVDNANTPDCGGWNAQGISEDIRARGQK